MKMYRYVTLSFVGALLLMTGCVTTRQARSTKASAFLGDAAPLLQPGKSGEANLIYVKPDVDWKKYKSIIIEPVTFWVGEGEDDGLSGEERKALCNYFHAQLVEAFTKSNYTVVDAVSAPDTIRLSAAIINAKHSWPVLATVSTIVPMALAVSTLKTIVTGKPSFVGEVNGELKATDSITGELLAAGADTRVGGMGWKGKFDRWGAAQASAKYWSEKTVYRLCRLQGLDTCQAPSDY